MLNEAATLGKQIKLFSSSMRKQLMLSQKLPDARVTKYKVTQVLLWLTVLKQGLSRCSRYCSYYFIP